MNKRRHQRIEVQNVIANLSDEVNFFSGTVSDISRAGISLTDVPKELHDWEKELSIIVSAKGKEYKMLVIPKWLSKNYSKTRMGLEILDAPLDWTIFVLNYEPTDENIWATITHLPDC